MNSNVSAVLVLCLGMAPGYPLLSAQEIPASTPPVQSAPRPVPQRRPPLLAATKVSFNALPTPVQESIRNYAGIVRIDDIEKGTLVGQTVYQATLDRKTTRLT